jgi:phosphoribosylformylglycinamidine synthase subunit PurQ / glutaminase
VKKKDMRIAILRIEGTNCEQESLDAFKQLHTTPEFVHLKQLLHVDTNPQEERTLTDFHCLMIPGGFSAGDYIRAGAILAARMKSKLGNDLKNFVKEGYPVLGICNGFQVLIELGLLPGSESVMSSVPKACLHQNDSSRFECRPSLLKHVNKGTCACTTDIDYDDVRLIPSAHAEGKLIFNTKNQKKIVKQLEDNDQIVFKYVNPSGEYEGYPWNPNGSFANIAGICNREGNVFGMMPHPERVFHRLQHHSWPENGLNPSWGDGKAIFTSIVSYLEKNF